MPELPSHPDTTPTSHTDLAVEPVVPGWSQGRKLLVIAAVIGLLVLVAVLHLTGVVGGEGH
ncbi:hypothetical protein [Streptomyces sp. NPDC002088]|uniref:hypothetical protein n=1 Tax=Streptomyces sp. NPDC002088 TaxID=3154665 RepID=UPI003323B723